NQRKRDEGTFAHRVMCECPQCHRVVSVGRLAQHMASHSSYLAEHPVHGFLASSVPLGMWTHSSHYAFRFKTKRHAQRALRLAPDASLFRFVPISREAPPCAD